MRWWTTITIAASLVAPIMMSQFALAQPAPASGAKKPNILVIWGDDIGQFNLSVYNNGMMGYRTPNIDRIAKEGAIFTDWYGQQSCTAGRAAFITGQSPIRTGLTKVGLPGAPEGMKAEDPTIAGLLKPLGYVTGQFGKNHLGDRDEMLPTNHGFDEFFGFPATNDRVPTVYVRDHRVLGLDPADPINYTYDAKTAAAGGMKKWAAGRDRIGFMSGGKAAWWKDETIADTFTHEVVGFIERNKQQPFFLYFAPHDVHPPIIPNPRFVGSTTLGKRADMLSELDWSVGEIMKTLERLGLTKNTLIIFSSDNGASPYNEKGHLPNGPWHGKKSQLWEGGHREPFIAHWPGHIAPGTTSDDLVCLVDLTATAAALVGENLASEAAPDSFNLLPAMLGNPKQIKRDHLIVMSGKGDLAIRQGQWKYIPDLALVDGWDAGPKKPNQPAKPALYDLSTDKGETKNLVLEKPQIAKRMAELLEKIKSAKSSRPAEP